MLNYVTSLVILGSSSRSSKARSHTVSGCVFADDSVGISETPEGLLEQVKKALEYTRNGE